MYNKSYEERKSKKNFNEVLTMLKNDHYNEMIKEVSKTILGDIK